MLLNNCSYNGSVEFDSRTFEWRSTIFFFLISATRMIIFDGMVDFERYHIKLPTVVRL